MNLSEISPGSDSVVCSCWQSLKCFCSYRAVAASVVTSLQLGDTVVSKHIQQQQQQQHNNNERLRLTTWFVMWILSPARNNPVLFVTLALSTLWSVFTNFLRLRSPWGFLRGLWPRRSSRPWLTWLGQLTPEGSDTTASIFLWPACKSRWQKCANLRKHFVQIILISITYKVQGAVTIQLR